MSVYMTEAEQIEWLKKGWVRYQTWIISGLCVVLLLMSGVKYWHHYHDKRMQQASVAYSRMLLAESQHLTQKTQVYAEQLIAEDSGTVYSDVARLMLASIFTQQKKYDQARNMLEFISIHSTRHALVDLSKIRLARIWMATQQYTKSLAVLQGMKNSPYSGLVNVTKGDLYVAMGNKLKAMKSYQLAHAYLAKDGVTHVFLDMKLEQLKEEG